MNACMPAPLERLMIPAELDGRDGANRARGGVRQIEADNDLQALETWLAEFRGSPRTFRHYRKEGERLLLWALLERRKPLSGLTREDCILYEDFLADPQPRDRWCGPKAPRFSSRWRPLQGPLQSSSRHTALLIVNSLFSYLVKAGYLAGNPLALVRRRKSGPSRTASVERFLEKDQWRVLLETVESLPKDTARQCHHYQRVRFLVALLYLLGPRVSEIAQHTMGSFVEIRGRWWWTVLGKGQKAARVPVNQDMLEALRHYRSSLGLSPLPPPGDTSPLLLSLKGTSGITDNMIYRLIKDLVRRAAARLAETDARAADRLRQASTHWFRHTSLTHQADAGIGLRFLQRNARHARLDTTALYLHAEEDEWHDAMEQHRLREQSR